jgi:transcriptional regulator
VAVHAYGRARIIEDRDGVIDVLQRLTAINEAGFTSPWSIDELEGEQREGFLRAIVAFEIPVSRLEGQFKLSQNRSAEDRHGVVTGLERIGNPQAAEVAARMRASLD